MKKLIALLLALVMVLGMFAACAPAEEEPAGSSSAENTPPATSEQESETPLVIQWDQATGTDRFEPPYKDNSLSYHTIFLWSKLYDTDQSKEKDDDSRIVWDLATKMEWSADDLSVTITIRDDAKWHDGEAVTAEDLAFTIWANVVDPISTSKGGWDKVVGYEALSNGEATELEGVKVVDDYTLTITRTEPMAEWMPNFQVLPAHCFEGVAAEDLSTSAYWDNPIGSGPYKIATVNCPDGFTMTRNDDYYGKRAGIKNVTAVSIEAAGSDAAVAAVISGDVDITTRTVTSAGPIASNIVKQNPDCVSKAMYSNNIRSFVFNMGQRTDGNNKDVLVNSADARLAISLLIDEDTIAQYVAADACKVMGNPNNANTTHELDDANKSLDVDKAKSLLDAAGWDYDTEIDILDYYGDTVVAGVMEIIKADFAKAGVKMNHVVVAGMANLGDILYTDRNWDLMFYQAGNSDENPAAALGMLKGESWTFMYPNTAIVDKYMALQSAVDTNVYGTQAHTDAVHAIQKANYEDTLIIPVYVNSTVIVYNAAHIYVPDTAFDYYDNVLDLDQWVMLK